MLNPWYIFLNFIFSIVLKVGIVTFTWPKQSPLKEASRPEVQRSSLGSQIHFWAMLVVSCWGPYHRKQLWPGPDLFTWVGLIPRRDGANLAIHKSPQSQRQRWEKPWHSSPGMRLTDFARPVPVGCRKMGRRLSLGHSLGLRGYRGRASACVEIRTGDKAWVETGTKRTASDPRGNRDTGHVLGLRGEMDRASACAGTGTQDMASACVGTGARLSLCSICSGRDVSRPLVRPHSQGPGDTSFPSYLSPLLRGRDSSAQSQGPGVSTAVHPGTRASPGLGASWRGAGARVGVGSPNRPSEYCRGNDNRFQQQLPVWAPGLRQVLSLGWTSVNGHNDLVTQTCTMGWVTCPSCPAGT